MRRIHPLHIGRLSAHPRVSGPQIHTRGGGHPLRISPADGLMKVVVCCSVAIGTFDALDLHRFGAFFVDLLAIAAL